MRKRTCVEYGPGDGLASMGRLFEDAPGWQCVNAESSQERFTLLTRNRPRSVNVNFRLGTKTSGRSSLPPQTLSFADFLTRTGLYAVDLLICHEEPVQELLQGICVSCVYPDVLVLPQGSHVVPDVDSALSHLNYRLDMSLFEYSFFVREDAYDVRKVMGGEKSRSLPEIIQTSLSLFKEGRLSLSGDEFLTYSPWVFASLAYDSLDGGASVCLYSLAGVEGKSCDGQTVVYRLTGKSGRRRLIWSQPQPRPDYASWRGEQYLNAGSRMIVDRSFFPEDEYTVEVIVQQEQNYLASGSWQLCFDSSGSGSLSQS